MEIGVDVGLSVSQRVLEAIKTPTWLVDVEQSRCIFANSRAKNICEDLLSVECLQNKFSAIENLKNLILQTLKEGKESFECTFATSAVTVLQGTFSVSAYPIGNDRNLLLVENHKLEMSEQNTLESLWDSESIRRLLPSSKGMLVIYDIKTGKVVSANEWAKKKILPMVDKYDNSFGITSATFLPHVLDRTLVERVIGKARKGEKFQAPVAVELNDQTFAHMLTTQVYQEPQSSKMLLIAYEEDITEFAPPPKSKKMMTEESQLTSEFTGLLGMSELFLETFLSKQQPECNEVLRDSIHSLLRIINTFDLLQIEHGSIQFPASEFDTYQLIEDCVDFVTPLAREKGLEISAILPTSIPAKLMGDGRRIKQILLNFLTNAIQVTERGEITVVARIDRDSAKDVQLYIEVIDTGVGVSKDRFTTLFPDFTINSFKVGSQVGLGLVISKQIAELMGGTVGFHSQLGAGSGFWVSLSLEKPFQNVGPTHQFKNLPCKECASLTAVVVSSSPMEKRVLSNYLESWKVKVVFVATGAECLNLLNNQGVGYELLFISCSTPDYKPTELVKEIQSLDQGNFFPVIMSSQGSGDRSMPTLPTPIHRGRLFQILEKFGNWKRVMSVKRLDIKRMGDHMERMDLKESTRQIKQTSSSSDINVLVVEDNALAQMFASRTLGKKGGFKVDAVANGVMAVESFKKNSYDLILMDCQMPELDGYAATKQIRELEKETGGHVVIIAVTAMTLQEDRDRCFQMGMDDYISKPVTNKRMLDKIEQWTEQVRITKEEGEFGCFNQLLPVKSPRRSSPSTMSTRPSLRQLLNAQKGLPFSRA